MNLDSFELTARWPSPPAPEAPDVAELRISAAGETLIRICDFDRKEDRDYVRGSAVSLAFWLADNFWRLRYESLPDGHAPSTNWRLRHEMTSAAGGTLWPPIMVHSTGERVLFASAYAKSVDIGAIRYALPEMVMVSGSAFANGLDRYFDEVVATCAHAIDGVALQELVGTLRLERSDPNMMSWRRLEARLGYDPDTVPTELMRTLGKLERHVGESALDEAAAATPGREAGNYLASVVEAARESEVVVDLGIARQVAANDLAQPSAARPWEQGRAAARRVRDIAGLGDRPVRAQAFSDLLQTKREDLQRRGTARGLPYSARLRQHGDRQRIALQSANPRDRRFELSCALADEIWAHSDFGIISKAKTDRQKFQRAFAQNLLVPFSDLAARIDLANPTELQIQEAAVYYHVHPNVIRRLLILEGVLPEETFEERLEAA
ncbi:MAG TPA: hypothetical protein VF574_11580 [Allosphingosinicella sp.]